jgi:serine/threonine protein phosphatase 1
VKQRSGCLLTIDGPPKGSRVIVIGDIHGCIEELHALLERVGPNDDDIVICAGDVVRKGLRPDLCLELIRDHRYMSVIGNNENKLLGFENRGLIRRLFLSPQDRRVLRRRDLLDFIRSWPAVIDIPSIDALVVHGGLFPGMTIDERTMAKSRDDLIRLRYIRRVGGEWKRVPKGSESAGAVLWPEVWDGDRTVLYGHTLVDEPRVDRRAIGLDTGCVYGGSLSAAIYERGQWRTEQVRARRMYTRS